MTLFKKAEDLAGHLSRIHAKGLKTGFVPTMGALHDGHLSLIAASLERADMTICSIFVNPTQFNDPTDFDKYPVTIENDIALLEKAGCEVLFLPSVVEIYPSGPANSTGPGAGFFDTVLEGSNRPGHFKGVLMVMSRLLDIVRPDLLFLGQKDYQQCMVIKQFISQSGLATQTIIVPTMREPDGLAMSSRNTRLGADDRQKAPALYKALLGLKASLVTGELDTIKIAAESKILAAGFTKVDYVSLSNANTLEPLAYWDGREPVVALVAAFIGGVRLIDNMVLT